MARYGKLLAVAVASCVMVAGAVGQSKGPVETRNAALRYWLAFADLQDSSTDKATQELLEKTAAGDASWDEAKLGPLLDKNDEAIERMQRATKLPECDWGLEYSLGPRASVSYVSRARVLGRLNTLYGMRLLAKGDSLHGVDAWLDGIKFSEHLAQGGTLLATLVGKTVLVSDLNAIAQAARHGSLSAAEKAAAARMIRALPESGFDWSRAWSLDGRATENGVIAVMNAKDRKLAYETLTGEPMGNTVVLPGPELLVNFHEYIGRVAEAFRTPSTVAEAKLRNLEADRKALNEAIQRLIPSPMRVNDARKEVALARELTLQALEAK